MQCGTCGRNLADTAKFCGTCGTAVVHDQPATAALGSGEASAGSSGPPSHPERSSAPQANSGAQAWDARSQSAFTPFLLAVTGLAVVLGAQELAYSFADGSGAKPVYILLLLVGMGLASAAAVTTVARARAALDSQAPLTGDVLVLLVGLLGGLVGLFRFLSVLGQ